MWQSSSGVCRLDPHQIRVTSSGAVNGKKKIAVADWQGSYRRLFTLADLKNADGTRKRCYPHMFRDTFAVELLLAGVRLDQVSILLGHKSIKTTEKHYSPFVKARQEQLVQAVKKAWVGARQKKMKAHPTKARKRAAAAHAGWTDRTDLTVPTLGR